MTQPIDQRTGRFVPKDEATVDRFMRYVRKEPGCWTWIGGRDPDGYGIFRVSVRKQARAPKWSWEFFVGRGQSVPAGSVVMHTCDNPPCVNPDHLRLGTHKDNHADRNQKGRQAKGAGHGHAKLTQERVRQIRALVAAGGQHEAVGAAFGVSKGAVAHIVHRRSWGHV